MKTPDPDNELNIEEVTDGDMAVSLILDGIATPQQHALVEGDPALITRLESFRSVVALVSEEVPAVAAQARETTIASALSALDDIAEAESDSVVIDLSSRRKRRSTIARFLVAAVVTVALGVPALITFTRNTTGSRSNELAATSQADASRDSSAGAGEKAAESDAPQSASGSPFNQGPTSTTAAMAPMGGEATDTRQETGLGAVSSLEELRLKITGLMPTNSTDAAVAGIDEPTTTTVVGSPGQQDVATICETSARMTTGTQGAPTITTTATYLGSFSYVFAFTTPGGTVVVVMTPASDSTCAVTTTLTL